jgi:Flp pilus assembly protein CpaB
MRRDPRLWWVVTLVCAVTLGWMVSTVLSRADAARRSWGATQTVVVARHHIAAGEELGPGDIDLAARPAALVPEHALRELPDGQRTSGPVEEGEILVTSRLAAQGAGALAATMPPGTRAVAIPLEPGLAPPLTVGDRVDVLVALPAEAAGDGPPGFVVAADVPVLAVSDAAVTVAVAPATAPRVAVALGAGAVSVALVGADASTGTFAPSPDEPPGAG